MDDALQALLQFIRGEGDGFSRHYGGCLTSWPGVGGEQCRVTWGCLELERRGLIRRDCERDGRIVWRAKETG
jgi:hypothetical protein